MEDYVDLEQTITDAVNDSQAGVEDPTLDERVEVQSDTTETPTETAQEAPQEAQESNQVSSPASQQQDAPKDEFEQIAGVPQMGVTGRENRIPYSRVKQIVGNGQTAVVESVIGRKLNKGENPVDVAKAFATEIGTLRNEHAEYTQRLEAVGQFEAMLQNTPDAFLKKLAELPQYEPFFTFMQQAYDHYAANGNSWGAAPTTGGNPQLGQNTQSQTQQVDPDAMPDPDETLADGSKQYSMTGIRSLLDWQDKRTAARVSKELQDAFEKRYGPIETDWKEYQRREALRPVIQKQLAEAQTWPMWKEVEDDVANLMAQDQKISLEAAYRQVAFPRILAERSRIKQDVIKELQQSPVTNSAVAPRVTTKPGSQEQAPKTLEEIIAAEVEKLKR